MATPVGPTSVVLAAVGLLAAPWLFGVGWWAGGPRSKDTGAASADACVCQCAGTPGRDIYVLAWFS